MNPSTYKHILSTATYTHKYRGMPVYTVKQQNNWQLYGEDVVLSPAGRVCDPDWEHHECFKSWRMEEF